MTGQIQKIWVCALAVLCAVGCFQVPVNAQSEAYSWYCAHVKGHEQPTIGTELRFVEEHDGYFIDRNHTSSTDQDKVIYLTFDAGYENGNVAKILDVLKSEGVTGAFFVLGHLISSHPELIQRMVDEGHTVCNHTVRHKDMSCASEDVFLQELSDLETQFQTLTGKEMARYYRPPEGRFSKDNLITAQKNGYKTVFWSFAYPDWDNSRQMSCEKAKQIILENLHNGEVMLLHPTSAVNAEILGDVIREAKSQGYRFGSLDELTGNCHGEVAE